VISPRTQIVSSAYSFNADKLDGIHANATSPWIVSLSPTHSTVQDGFSTWGAGDSSGVWVDWDQVPQNYTQVRLRTWVCSPGSRYPCYVRLVIGGVPVAGAASGQLGGQYYDSDWVSFVKPSGLKRISLQGQGIYGAETKVESATVMFR
jgi:hypothetical protein